MTQTSWLNGTLSAQISPHSTKTNFCETSNFWINFVFYMQSEKNFLQLKRKSSKLIYRFQWKINIVSLVEFFLTWTFWVSSSGGWTDDEVFSAVNVGVQSDIFKFHDGCKLIALNKVTVGRRTLKRQSWGTCARRHCRRRKARHMVRSMWTPTTNWSGISVCSSRRSLQDTNRAVNGASARGRRPTDRCHSSRVQPRFKFLTFQREKTIHLILNL